MESRTRSKKNDNTSMLNIDDIKSKEIILNDEYKKLLPSNYDLINQYVNEIRVDLITNLNNYFKATYSECEKSSHLSDNINEYSTIANKPKKKFRGCLISGIVLLLVSVIGWILYGCLIGTNPIDLQNLANQLQNDGVINTPDGWMSFFMVWLAILCILTAASIGCLIASDFLYKKIPKAKEQETKSEDFLFELFINNFKKADIYEVIESTIPNLNLNYDVNKIQQQTLDTWILDTINLGKNVKLVENNNFIDGTYNNHYFKIHQINCNWNNNSNQNYQANLYCLGFETNNSLDVDFILNGVNENKLNLSNQIFNELFTLNANNNENALKLFNTRVQHNLCRLITWNPIMKSILQVIKHQNKIYVIFKSTDDFFKFNKLTYLNYKQLFNKNQINNDQDDLNQDDNKMSTNFELSADLMSNYIVENVNLFYSVLLIADCFNLQSINENIIIPQIIVNKE